MIYRNWPQLGSRMTQQKVYKIFTDSAASRGGTGNHLQKAGMKGRTGGMAQKYR